jgi:hypothetical protein
MRETRYESISISKLPGPQPAPRPDPFVPASAHPYDEARKAKPSSEPFRSATNGVIISKPLKPSHVARNDPHFEREVERFDAPVHQPYDYEIKKTAAEADKELKELFQGAMEDGPAEIDMSEAIVDGFGDGIVLKPHQVRPW